MSDAGEEFKEDLAGSEEDFNISIAESGFADQIDRPLRDLLRCFWRTGFAVGYWSSFQRCKNAMTGDDEMKPAPRSKRE